MTTPTGTPAPRPRLVLSRISANAWEHPADRAALNALRSVPGFDETVKKILGFFGERGIRLLFQANAVRCGPTQFPRLHGLLTEACVTFDWPEQPELYVSQTPLVNAGAVGFEHPFIVLNSGAVKLLDEDEMRVLISHELGHVMSGHAVYRTVTILLLELGFHNLPFLAGIALLPVKLALLEWYRKSELSSDRAGLLGSQDPEAAVRIFLKLAGGGTMGETDLESYRQQVKEYDEGGGPLDAIYKVLNTLGASHPFNTIRAAEVQNWIESGAYQDILDGKYQRRGSEEPRRSYADDLGDAAHYYGKEVRDVAEKVVDSARRAADAFGRAFKEPPPK